MLFIHLNIDHIVRNIFYVSFHHVNKLIFLICVQEIADPSVHNQIDVANVLTGFFRCRVMVDRSIMGKYEIQKAIFTERKGLQTEYEIFTTKKVNLLFYCLCIMFSCKLYVARNDQNEALLEQVITITGLIRRLL